VQSLPLIAVIRAKIADIAEADEIDGNECMSLVRELDALVLQFLQNKGGPVGGAAVRQRCNGSVANPRGMPGDSGGRSD